MTNKQKFITMVEELIKPLDLTEYSDEMEYFEFLKNDTKAQEITEKGINILKYMQNNNEQNKNLFSAKTIGEGIVISPKSVSSSMRKLVDNGYVSKTKNDVVMYSLTEKGNNYKIED